MRTELIIPIEKELELIEKLSNQVIKDGYNASNTIIVTVSSDYSAITGMLMRHNLSFEGEICEGFSIDVPYPDQSFNEDFLQPLSVMMSMHCYNFDEKTLLLVENGIIRGSNYKFLTEWIKENYPQVKVKTLTLFENIHSIFKSDYVGQMYDNDVSDLTFHFERYNRHWQ